MPTKPRQYRGDTAEVRRLERRTKLLDAAKQVFGERGFHGTTVKAICEAAGLTERYFYESFSGNEALFIAMHKRTSDTIITTISNAIVENDPKERRLNAAIEAYFSFIRSDPVSARLFAIDAGFISPAAKEVCTSWRFWFGHLLVRALSKAPQDSSAILRSGIIRALLGIGVDWMEGGFSEPQEAIVDAGVRVARILDAD